MIEFAARFPAAREPLLRWHTLMAKTDFASFAELRAAFGAADRVGKLTVFDIGGNKYRLVAAIHYNRRRVYIRHVLTHVEYDKDNWKEK